MGRFTALDDHLVDKTIEDHLQYIVNSIISQIEPQSIILRGSFGRGEGSVIVHGDKLSFLSDYEIDVATLSPFYRSLFSRLTRQLTSELGVDVGIRWVRPDYLLTNRIGPFLVGEAPISISSYETRYGSKILYGEDFINSCSAIDPGKIQLESGIQLIFNRMAESLIYMSNNSHTIDDLRAYYWINKTVLACAESLLILWKQYHFLYKERGLRFEVLAQQRLSFMLDQGPILCEFVARATEFKLRPNSDLYPLPIEDTWQQVVPIVDTIFRHLIKNGPRINFQSYVEFPTQYIHHSSQHNKLHSLKLFSSIKLLEVYRCMRVHYFPKSLLLPYHAYQVVYSVVPLLFIGLLKEERLSLVDGVRYWLMKLGPLKERSTDPNIEWDYLRQRLIWYWKVFCHG